MKINIIFCFGTQWKNRKMIFDEFFGLLQPKKK